jgi:uncharacterized protein (DUF2235 family)
MESTTSKSILIFSDGTGQSGGLTPDQRLSNVYKLFRAMRIGPDNPVNPADQVAFYDPGLGSEGAARQVRGKWRRAFRKFASSATGAGIGHNITDCYEAILKHYEPGDRIYLFGFSRGAYTARSVAGVLRYCGVPTRLPDGTPIPRWGSGLRAIAHEAVHQVYEYGSGRRRQKFEAERKVLAARFREKYACEVNGTANAAPYFIGVFDTVAALGERGFVRWIMRLGLLVGAAGAIAIAAFLVSLFGVTFRNSLAWVASITTIIALTAILKARVKFIWKYPTSWQFRWCVTGWKFKDYDTNLDGRVCFARHAMAIDETRGDFARVPWGQPSEGPRPDVNGVKSFVQLWFAGDHSDIGGSYPEDESRLSDIALKWMVDELESIPHAPKIDRSQLNVWPDACGMQHSEVEAVRDAYPWWVPKACRLTWSEKPRSAAAGSPHHPSVLQRFEAGAVVNCNSVGPYRPVVLAKDARYAHFFDTSATEGLSPSA